MRRRNAIRDVALLSLVIGGSAIASAAEADIDAITAANQRSYDALAALDIPAVEAAWGHKPNVLRIGPNSRTIAVGWDAVQKGLENTVKRLSDTYSSMSFMFAERHVQIAGEAAWVVGILEFQGQGKDGKTVTQRDFVTDVLEKDGDRWLMVSHHAQRAPE